MEPFLWLLALALWAVICVRTLGFHATLSLRTLAVYGLLGAMIAVVAAPLVAWLIAPYGVHWPIQAYLIHVGQHFLLVLPVVVVFLQSGVFRTTSVADIFLAGFCLGLGFDFAGAALLALLGTTAADILNWFPPFTYSGQDSLIPGCAYWTSLISVVPAALFRFAGRRLVVALAGAALFFGWVTVESTALISWAPPDSFPASFIAGTGHGNLTPWLVFIMLPAVSFLELRWASEADARAPVAEMIRELVQAVKSLLTGHPKQFVRDLRLAALRRQANIARAEARSSPPDQRIAAEQTARHLAAMVSRMVSQTEATAVPFSSQWKVWAGAAALWIGLFVLLVPRPEAVVGVAGWFWRQEWLHLALGGFPGLFNGLLIVLLVIFSLRAAAKPSAAPDDFVRFWGERAILAGVLWVVCAILVGGMQGIYPFPSWIARVVGVNLPSFSTAQQQTLILLFVGAATGVTLARASRWRQAPIRLRRAAALRNGLNFLSLLVVFWLCFTVYPSAVQLYHARNGPELYQQAYQASAGDPRETTWRGNLAAARTVILLTVLAGGGAYFLLQVGNRRIRRFMGME